MQQKQLLDRLSKAEQRIVDLYAKLNTLKVGTYSREIVTLPVPTLNANIVIPITSLDTVILFNGDITNNFNLNVTSGPNTVQGDRIYLFVKGTNSKIITVGNKLNPVTCGSADFNIIVQSNMICHEMVYDGNKFTGIDNC